MNHSKEIQKKIIETQEKLEKHGYPKFHVTFSIDKLEPGYAGLAYSDPPHISISSKHLNSHHASEVISRIVPHELVHTYVDKYHPEEVDHHGGHFTRLMNLIGVNPDPEHNMAFSTNKYKVDGPVYHVWKSADGEEVHVSPEKHKELTLHGTTAISKSGKLLNYYGDTVTF